MIANRVQEQAFGTLDHATLNLLDGTIARRGGARRSDRNLKIGTVLVRDYRGRRHTVTVGPDGYVWDGAGISPAVVAALPSVPDCGGAGLARGEPSRLGEIVAAEFAQRASGLWMRGADGASEATLCHHQIEERRFGGLDGRGTHGSLHRLERALPDLSPENWSRVIGRRFTESAPGGAPVLRARMAPWVVQCRCASQPRYRADADGRCAQSHARAPILIRLPDRRAPLGPLRN
jgi:hypothetical protein